MRPALLLALLLAACGEKERLAILQTGSLPEGTTTLELGETPTYRLQWSWKLKVKSTVKKTVGLSARIEDPVPKGMRVMLRGEGGETSILREGGAEMSLILVPPKELGPFAGTIALFSEDLPDWSYRYSFRGTVVQKPRQGRYIETQPSNKALGKVRAKQRIPFVFALRNVGDETLVINSVRSLHEKLVVVRRHHVGTPIVAGGEVSVSGEVLTPRRGSFEGRVEIVSDAVNRPRQHFIITGTVDPDYAAEPDRLDWQRIIRGKVREVAISIKGREGTDPFTIGAVDGTEPHFEVVATGEKTAAKEQVLTLRLSRRAPVGRRTSSLLVHLEPIGEEVEIPVSVQILPTIHYSLTEIRLGNQKGSEEVRLSSFANRPFKVTSARCRKDRFVVSTRHAPGMPWIVQVSIPKGMPRGIHNDSLLIKTDDPDTPTITIPVSATIR